MFSGFSGFSGVSGVSEGVKLGGKTRVKTVYWSEFELSRLRVAYHIYTQGGSRYNINTDEEFHRSRLTERMPLL